MEIPNEAGRRKSIERLYLIGAAVVVVVGLGVLAPIIFAAVEGLIGIGIMAGLIIGAIYFTPVIAQKAANLRMAALKAEAAKRPIETMQTIYQEWIAKLHAFGDQMQRFSAKIESTKSKLALLQRKYPTEAETFKKFVDNMVLLKNRRWEQYQRAEREVALYHDEIEKADAIWQMALEAKDLEALSGVTTDVMDEIKTKTAVESVQLSANESFAQLERLMMERVDEPALLASGQTVDVEVTAAEPQRSRR